MPQFESGGRVYYIEFTHFSPEEYTRAEVGTACTLRWGPVGTPRKDCHAHVGAQVTLYYKDQYNKAAGRKYALAKVLEGFPKSFRTIAWEAYHGRGGSS